MKLSKFELAWASAAFDAVFPEGTALPVGIARLNPARRFAEILARAPFEQSIGLRLTLWLIALSPFWILRRPETIATIAADERQRVLERLLANQVYAVRQLVVGFKAVAAMLYAQSPEARAAMTIPVPTSLVELRPLGPGHGRAARGDDA